ncbi:MAG: hypothetical protein AAF394_03750, partial [Planctomycetota bacterium]
REAFELGRGSHGVETLPPSTCRCTPRIRAPTGLVRQDSDGFLHFQGRLKRFLKAGGEMISLPALEEPLSKAFPADENGPKVAVEGVETPDGRHIVLFTTVELSIREASDLLLEAGLRGVMRLDEVQRIDSIPVLGTGKTDYKELRKLVMEAAGV